MGSGRFSVTLMIGAPGAGKGTQARFVRETLGIPHVATGDLLREHRRRGTALGRTARAYMDRGDLVPDDLVVKMVIDRLEQPDAANGVLLDGFPRTLAQAASLDAELRRAAAAWRRRCSWTCRRASWSGGSRADACATAARARSTWICTISPTTAPARTAASTWSSAATISARRSPAGSRSTWIRRRPCSIITARAGSSTGSTATARSRRSGPHLLCVLRRRVPALVAS